VPPGTIRLLLSLVLASLTGCSVASTCARETVSCGGTCVETRADNLHCGACGNKCPVGTACSMGVCEASCSVGQVACGGACIDPRTDAAHCGASGDCSGANAGTACGSGPTCQDGTCVRFTAPTITTQPASQNVEPGRAATFTVTASGTAPLHYKWMKGPVQVGSDSATFTIASALAGDAGGYTVIVSNMVGNQASVVATLTVGSPSTGLAWSDEFDGPEIDSTRWAFDLGNGPTNPGPLYGWGNGEWEYYTSSRDNAAIENGSLVITARRQDWGGRSFTSARLVTRGKYSFRQGRFVARIKMPEGNRMWPAFWLLGDRVESWPMCGEVDIAEMFAGAAGRGDDAVFATAHWWDETTASHGMNGVTYTIPAKLSADFHDYELEWDDHFMRGKIDGHEYWTLDITAPAMSELRDNFYYIVLNLAVGSPGFGMTSADQANGPLPQRMYVDYVRVYSNAGSTVEDKVASQPHGRFGILADGTATDSQIDLATDANLYLWNNLVAVKGTPAAGASSLAVRTLGTSWFGFGYAAAKRRNLLNYAAGYLNVSIKTTSTNNFKVGINGGNDGDAWVNFANGSDPFGFVRDGQWHKVSIPMTRFGNADFSDIRQFFMVAGPDAVTAGATFEFDEIYWSENAPENIVHPVGARFGVYTERDCDAGVFDPATDGGVFIWNPANGAVVPGVPFEGASSIAFSAPGAAWYGLGLAPTKLHDLSAFARGHLHVALKVPSSRTADFKIGVKSPGGMAVRESWIKFKSGSDPYGMVRDGRYHELLIPAADFGNSDFGAISQLFMLAGDGPGSVEFDDVYWTAE
jgi:beta-glucanase (GH16 family)